MHATCWTLLKKKSGLFWCLEGLLITHGLFLECRESLGNLDTSFLWNLPQNRVDPKCYKLGVRNDLCAVSMSFWGGAVKEAGHPAWISLVHFRCFWARQTLFLLGLCFSNFPLIAWVGEEMGKTYVLVGPSCFCNLKDCGKHEIVLLYSLALMKKWMICCACSLISPVCSAPSSSDSHRSWWGSELMLWGMSLMHVLLILN